MANHDETELLTVPETAALLRLKQSTIRAWIYRKKLAYIKLGSRVFTRRADIQELIAGSLVPAGRKPSVGGVPTEKKPKPQTA